jgi:hypothetical protein
VVAAWLDEMSAFGGHQEDVIHLHPTSAGMPSRLELSAKAQSQDSIAALEVVSEETGELGSASRALVLVLPNK